MNLPSNSVDLYKEVYSQKQAILAEMASLEIKQNQIKQQLADIDGFIRTFDRWGKPPQDEVAATVPTSAQSELPTKKKKTTKQDLLTNMAVEVLADGKILTTDQILNELACRNLVIGGENPSGNLSAILSRAKQFIYSRSAKGWMLAPAMEARPVELP